MKISARLTCAVINKIFEVIQPLPQRQLDEPKTSSDSDSTINLRTFEKHNAAGASEIWLSQGYLRETSPITPHCSVALGWLDVLIAGSSPKPEIYFTEKKSANLAVLSVSAAANFTLNVSEYLLASCNFGGERGIDMADVSIIRKIQAASALLKVLAGISIITSDSGATSTGKAGGGLLALFSKDDERVQETLKKAINNLINWYVANKVNNHD